MIGLVLGNTQLGSLIVKRLKKLEIKFTIIDISKQKLFSKYKNSYPLSIGQLGKAISILKKKKCEKVIFAGQVTRPNFLTTKFDLKGIYHLSKIIKNAKKGDSYIIKEIIKIFNKEKLKIIKQTYFNPELALKKGVFTKNKPDKNSLKDMKLGKKIITELKKNNVGQAVVVSNGNIVALEDQHGTNSMLNRANIILKEFPKKIRKKGILVKFPKTNQDLRIDLPTIGIKTLKKCSTIGLKGVVLKSKQNIFLDKEKSINFANKKKIFIKVI